MSTTKQVSARKPRKSHKAIPEPLVRDTHPVEASERESEREAVDPTQIAADTVHIAASAPTLPAHVPGAETYVVYHAGTYHVHGSGGEVTTTSEAEAMRLVEAGIEG